MKNDELRQKITQLFNHKGYLRYAKNISWLALEKLVRLLVGLFVSIWLARYLGPLEYGLLSYVQSYVFIFAVITSLGVDTIVVRELVEKNYTKEKILGTAFYLKLIATFVIFPLLYLTTYFLVSDDYSSTLIYIVAIGVIFQSFNVIDSYYQSVVQSKYVVIANVIAMLLSSLIKISLIVNNAPLIYFAIAYSVDAAIVALMLLIFYTRSSKNKLVKWSIDIKTVKYLVSESAPMWLSGLMIAIYAKTDQLMIQDMLGSEELGYYSAAAKLNDLFGFVPLIICSSLLPAIVNAKNTSKNIYFNRVSYLYSLMIWLSILILIIGSLLATQIVSLSFGSLYLKATETFKLLLWSNIFVFFFTAWAKFIIVERNQKLFFYFDSLAVITNIILNIVLIPRYGIRGAAFATVLAVPIAQAIIYILWKEQRYILKSFFRSLFLKF